jgi:ribosome-associated translation inhibitor RaiA
MSELTEPTEQIPVTVVAHGPISDAARRRAREVVLRAVRHERSPVVGARIALELHPDPAVERPAEVRVSLDVNGHAVRAAASAAEIIEAIDLLDKRIRRNLRAADEERVETRRPPRHRTA